MVKGSRLNFENILPLRSNLKNAINNIELLNIIGKNKKRCQKVISIKKIYYEKNSFLVCWKIRLWDNEEYYLCL